MNEGDVPTNSISCQTRVVFEQARVGPFQQGAHHEQMMQQVIFEVLKQSEEAPSIASEGRCLIMSKSTEKKYVHASQT